MKTAAVHAHVSADKDAGKEEWTSKTKAESALEMRVGVRHLVLRGRTNSQLCRQVFWEPMKWPSSLQGCEKELPIPDAWHTGQRNMPQCLKMSGR